MLSRGRGEPPLGRLSCFLGEEVGHPEFLSVRQACVLGPREAPPALCAKGSSWASQPWGLLVCRHPPHPAQCSPSRLGVTRWEGSQAPGCHLAGRIPPEDSAAPGPAPCVFCFRETHAGHPLTCSWVQMPRCVLGGARAERRGQRGRLGSMQTQLPSREVGLQPSSLSTRHPPKGKRPSCRRSGVNPSKGKQMVRPPQKELGTCPSLIFPFAKQ